MKKAIACFVGILAFTAYYFSTSPSYIGDTTRHANDVVDHLQGRNAPFWEFGHLLWRPWGYVGHELFAPLFTQWFGDTPIQVISRFLILTNFVCSWMELALLFFIVRRVASASVALVVVCGLSCSAAFIDYSHSGTPYLPALLCSTLAVYWLMQAAESPGNGYRLALGGGVAFGFACALWMPFAFTGLGMVAILVFWPGNKLRGRLLWVFLGSLAASVLVLFIGAAAIKGVTSFGQWVKWIRDSDNGVRQSSNAMRGVTGLPRSLWNLGRDTIYLKRWLFSDPFHPVKIYQMWAFRLAVKLATFYLAMGATAWVLWKERRPVLFMLLGSGVPLLLFAIFLFEPSATERFIPVLAFAFLGFAVVLSAARSHLLAFACVAALLGSMAFYNLTDRWRLSANARVISATQRIQALNRSVQPGALVYVVTFNDDLYRLPALYPLNGSLNHSRFSVLDAVTLAGARTALWSGDVAQRTLEQWARHLEVWVSERCLASRPEDDWQWVEGDDPRVHWRDIPAVFTTLEYDSSVPDAGDGFRRLAETQGNKERLTRQLNPSAP